MSNRFKDQAALQQQDSHTYTLGYDPSWQMGSMILGGCVTAAIMHVAQTHFNTTLASWKQPDVHTLHFEFFRPCTAGGSTVKVTDLKVGKGSSCIQLTLYQADNQVRCTALATSTDFGASLGPTTSQGATLTPAIGQIPDFDRIEAKRQDPNWLPSKTVTDLLPLLKDMTFLYPVEGQPRPGVIDYWCTFDQPEEFDAAHLALLSDVCPSPSDTLMRTEGVWDAHRIYRIKQASAAANPGQPAILTPSIKEASKAPFWNTTLTMDLQFKRRLTKDDRWTFTRATTTALDKGRMDLTMDIYDKDLRPLCLVRQLMLVIDIGRRFGPKKEERTSKM